MKLSGCHMTQRHDSCDSEVTADTPALCDHCHVTYM